MAGKTAAGRRAYIIGGGIAGMATAAYLIREGGLPGAQVFVLEESPILGGSLDGGGTPENGYILRGGRMFNFSYRCTYDLLSFIPSLDRPGQSVKDDIDQFNEAHPTESHCRLVEHGRKLDVTQMGFSRKDRLDLIEIIARSEASLGRKRVDECFSPGFFQTTFWFMWATMFAFQPWHSAVEFRRYLHRFVHEFPRINTLAGVDRTPFNQYDSVVLPLQAWLQQQGVHFELGMEVRDLDFQPAGDRQRVSGIHFHRGQRDGTIALNASDLVFVTNGSMTSGTRYGSMNAPPQGEGTRRDGGSWMLWERIAKGRPEFGRPSVFDERVDESKWPSFTVTLQDPLFFRLMEDFTGNVAGEGGLVTVKDSNWLMSVVLAHQPYYRHQPPGVTVFWGYGLFPDRVGNFVQKAMSECSGAELFIELCNHLGFQKELPTLLRGANSIPCMMPFITSQFLTRGPTDRPHVVPEGWENLAFIGNFCEQPKDVVFTVEYSVRSAQAAVFSLLGLEKEPPPVYPGERDPRVLLHALQTLYTHGEHADEAPGTSPH
ncbi:oleate hydratase [Corallococcus sp. M34]|uniref:oleate hydratase n=1 Tax=Citreicoccus inhibens TaxID=2849499 RepID=UPI001C215BE5|nr:oleate hydratase [Citreicoccus inhibens]MBU8894048.1 oleate hydratase [Citreicoccus inhibens]